MAVRTECRSAAQWVDHLANQRGCKTAAHSVDKMGGLTVGRTADLWADLTVALKADKMVDPTEGLMVVRSGHLKVDRWV